MNEEHDTPTYGLLVINHAYNEGAYQLPGVAPVISAMGAADG